MSKSDIKIVDNLLPQGYANQIETDLMRTGFPWYYIDDVTNYNYGNNSGLVHPAYDFGKQPTDWLPFIKPLVYHIEEVNKKSINELLRVRVGFLMPSVTYTEHNTPHIDFMMPHYTACYYVNDTDGDTVIFDQTLSDVPERELTEQVLQNYVEQTDFTVAESCSPKKNRLCIFDGNRFHASTKPKLHDKRLVISVNFT